MFLVDTVNLFTLFDFSCTYTTKQPRASSQDMQRWLWPHCFRLVLFRQKCICLQGLQLGQGLFRFLCSGLKTQFLFSCVIFQFKVPEKDSVMATLQYISMGVRRQHSVGGRIRVFLEQMYSRILRFNLNSEVTIHFTWKNNWVADTVHEEHINPSVNFRARRLHIAVTLS